MKGSPLCAEWPLASREMTDKGGPEGIHETFRSLPSRLSQLSMEEKTKLNQQLKLTQNKPRKQDICFVESPSSLKSQKAENNRVNLSIYKSDVQNDNRFVKGRNSNQEQIFKSQLCKNSDHDNLGENTGKREEFEDKHGDVQEETRPKQMYGGDEHDEEEKLIKDLRETEKDREPAASKPSVHQISVGRIGYSQPALFQLLVRLAESGKVSPSGEVIRAVHASVLSQVNHTFSSSVAKMNAMNEIITLLSSEQGKTAEPDVDGEILEEMPSFVAEDDTTKTEVIVQPVGEKSHDYQQAVLKVTEPEQPIKSPANELEQPREGKSTHGGQEVPYVTESEQPMTFSAGEPEQPIEGEGTHSGQAVLYFTEAEQPMKITGEGCEKPVEEKDQECEQPTKGVDTDSENVVLKVTQSEHPVKFSTKDHEQPINSNQKSSRNKTKKEVSNGGKQVKVVKKKIYVKKFFNEHGEQKNNNNNRVRRQSPRVIFNNRVRRQSPRVIFVKNSALFVSDLPGQNNNSSAVRKASCGIRLKRYRYMDLRRQPVTARCCSQGNSAGGAGASGFHGNSGSDGTRGSPNTPKKDNHGGKGSERGDGDRNGGDDNRDGDDYRNSENKSSPVSEVTSDLLPSASSAEPNYKWFRKKPDEDRGHGDLNRDIPEVLGLLSNGVPNIQDCDDELLETLRQVDHCLVHCLLSVENGHGQDDPGDCLFCTIIQSLFRHIVRDKTAALKECMTCSQLFEMMKFHLLGCCVQPSLGSDCAHTLALCRRIHRQGMQFSDRPQAWEKFLWDTLKELMTRLFDDVELPTLTPSATAPSPTMTNKRSLRRKVSARGKLNIILEDEAASPQVQQQKVSVRSTGICSVQSLSISSQSISVNSQSETEMSQTDILIRNLPDQPLPLLPREAVVNHEGVRAYRNQGCVSLPTEHAPRTLYDQLISFEERPTGEPGIGEVVYGSIARLRNIVEHWTHVKKMWWEGEKFPRVSREEGVILLQYSDQLQIGKTRYQEDVQWQKITQLGRGVTGRCYLARDFNTECQFCIKEILITSYQEDELLIWSNLDHSNIVQLYGAIRADSHIYILAEFIDGGCLTEHINNQRELNRRLSKAVALRYFKQLLEVLIYLQQNNVLHEDLKADNILLRTSTPQPEIVVADFGLARKVQPGERVGKTSPVGSQTQWSPEKAASLGYDFKSDVWAATCVLAHIFNGQPPWVQQYGHAAVLHYVISKNSPPLEDMPRNVTEDIQKLIQLGWTLDVESRPYAHELLQAINLECHPAGETLFSTVNSIAPGCMSGDQPLRGSGPDESGPGNGQGLPTVNYPNQGQTEVSDRGGPGESAQGAELAAVTVTTEVKVTSTTVSTTALPIPLVVPLENPAETNSSVPSQTSNNAPATNSWNNSDPQHHILEYVQDKGEIASTLSCLPKLPVFEEPVFGERLQSDEETMSSTHSVKPRSKSSPNISVTIPADDRVDTVFNSSDMFGSGSPPTVGSSVDTPVTQQLPPPNVPMHPGGQHGRLPGLHPHANPLNLHVDVCKASVAKPRLHTTMSTSALLANPVPSNMARRTSQPYTASPVLQKTATALDMYGTTADARATSRSSVHSANTSGSSPHGHDSQPTTPRSSTYDNQDKEMLSLTKDMFEGLMREPHSHTTGMMDLAQSLCSDNEEEDDIMQTVLLETSLEDMQASIRPNPHSSPDARDGSLIKFVNQAEELIAQVRIRDVNTEWRDVIVDIASPTIHSSDEFKRFFVLHQDGSIVDMSASVGKADVIVTVVPLDDKEDPQTWFIQDHKLHWD
ncbi:uncharacterized protein LOC135477509 [Liolophura sinensis]|uniref:uncharacterized protein LOC135477509 n=1 Tax=Liolophura sinensis TaxID=3198878 RepID=UPI003158BD62